MRKLFLKRILTVAVAVITYFSSVAAFSQDFVFANESDTTSSGTVLAEEATLSEEISTEVQSAVESESQPETVESENDLQTESTEGTTESEVAYLEYDDQPTTVEEVQAWIDAYVASGYSLDAKPHWQYEVDSSLMPSGWRCSYVEDANYSEGKYWTVFPKPVARTATHSVNDETSLNAAINAANNDPTTDYEITVTADITLTSMPEIINIAGVTIKSDASGPWIITRDSSSAVINETRHFKVSSGSLILENITLEGDWDKVTTAMGTPSGGGGVWVFGGTFTMNDGATIKNCYRSDVSGEGGSGGAVYVDKGTFIMNGGEISGNYAENYGGGVWVGDSEFELSMAKPIGNYITETGATSKFYMNGGTIKDNKADNAGGGVMIKGNSYFKMDNYNPAITENTTHASSGGVAVEFSAFELVNGNISGNEATAGAYTVPGSTRYNSGGVGIVASAFTMSGGSISGNSAMGSSSGTDPEGYGGGVWVGYASKTAYPDSGDGQTGNDFYSKFTMNGGKINDNYATRSGGGVLVVGGSTFDMYNGEIFDNETGSKGGGVAVSALAYYKSTVEIHSTFNLYGGEIYGNFATNQGGGIAVNASEFTMYGGEIYGNATTDAGGGVWVGKFEETEVENSTFTMSGGTIGGTDFYTPGSINDAAGAQGAGSAGEGNYATAFGGGIFVGNGTTFTMSDGSVKYNSTSSRAGGVAVKRSYFEMSGGAAISSNHATLSGGGVSVASSTFYMHGGSINGTNYTDYSAGGVRVGYDSEAYNDANGIATQEEQDTLDTAREFHGDTSYFYMTDGDITGNDAQYCGGGVVVRDGAKFYMGTGNYVPSIDEGLVHIGEGTFNEGDGTGTPTIKGNSAHYAGGGVFMGTFEMKGTAYYPTFYEDSAKFYMYGGAVIDANQTEWVTGAYGQWLYGGGVHVNWGCEFEMNGGDIINNIAAYCGGGVSVAGATFTMNDGHISGNSTKTSYNNPSATGLVAYGGGVWIGHAYTMDPDKDGNYSDGPAHSAGSEFTMTGGIIGGTEGYLDTSSSGSGTYYGNHAENDGGGVYVGGDSHFTMSGEAQINYNDTENSGGGVYVGPGDYGTGNTAVGAVDSKSYFNMEDGYILNNISVNDGGGVVVAGATFNMSKGYISGNVTTDPAATSGGVYVGQGTNTIDGTVKTYYGKFAMTGGVVGGLAGYYSSTTPSSESTGRFYGNHAKSSGGGMYVTDDAAFSMSGDAQVNYNDTEVYGGGVYVTAGENGTGNTSFAMDSGYILNNKSVNDGGGVYLSGIKFTLKDGCYISGNKTTSSTSAIRATSGGLFVEDYTNAGTTYNSILTIEGGLIGGTVKYNGNATTNGTASVVGGTLYGNYSAYYGGGVSAVNTDIIMTGGSIANNIANYQGGGVFLFASTLTMENAEIRGNQTLQNYGGGVCMFMTSSPLPTGGIGSNPAGTVVGASSMTMEAGASVQENDGKGYGGGIYNTGMLTMKSGSLVDNNTSSLGGGGIYTSVDGTLIMEAGSVVSNNNTSAGFGGGVCIIYGTIDMKEGALITGNINSASGGGGIYLQANSQGTPITNIIAGDVTNNTATKGYGGGIGIVGSLSTTSYSITGTISGNTAATNGGGIYYTSTSPSTTVNVSGATITANRAVNGGGIYSAGTAVVDVSGTAITANRATDGGGIYFTSTSTNTAVKVSVSGTTIKANMASSNGGGIYTSASRTKSLTVSDSTKITNNVSLGNGGGIYTTSTAYSNLDVTDTSTTFSGNRAAYATNDAIASNYTTYVSDSLAEISVYSYALNNWDINYAGTPKFYTIILDPNGGTFEGSVENLGYLYVAADNVAKPLEELGYVIDSSKNITYDATKDLKNNAAVVNASITTGTGENLVESGVGTLTKDGGHVKDWTIGSAATTASIDMASTAYYDATATVPTSLVESLSATASSLYAQWVTYSITLALADGVTWAELADNVAVTFVNTNSNASMTVLFTDPSMKPGNYYTIYPGTGALNGITTLGTDKWTVTADLPLSGQYYIKEITIDNGTADTSSVTPTNASSCEIIITIGKTAIPWGHWIYTSH